MDLTSLATAVVGSKVSNAVGDLEKGLGLDDQSNQQMNEFEKAAVEQRYKQRKIEREKERQVIHEGREAQRKQMKDKYSLDFDTSKSSSSSKRSSSSKGRAKSPPTKATNKSPPPPATEQTPGGQDKEEDKKCVIS